jgi:Phage terminase, small subunit
MRPKSKETKEMQGTFEPSKESDSVELTEWDGARLPAANKEWPPKIQALWNRRCRDLQHAGYLAEAFLTDLRRYCFAVAMAERAEEELMKNNGSFVVEEEGSQGNTYDVVSKWLTVWNDANRTIDKIGSKFGFSPLAASKIPAVKKDVKGNEENLLS